MKVLYFSTTHIFLKVCEFLFQFIISLSHHGKHSRQWCCLTIKLYAYIIGKNCTLFSKYKLFPQGNKCLDLVLDDKCSQIKLEADCIFLVGCTLFVYCQFGRGSPILFLLGYLERRSVTIYYF